MSEDNDSTEPDLSGIRDLMPCPFCKSELILQMADDLDVIAIHPDTGECALDDLGLTEAELRHWNRRSPPAQERRCERTGNPCGTDTWRVGHDCRCGPCQGWLKSRLKPQDLSSTIREALRAYRWTCRAKVIHAEKSGAHDLGLWKIRLENVEQALRSPPATIPAQGGEWIASKMQEDPLPGGGLTIEEVVTEIDRRSNRGRIPTIGLLWPTDERRSIERSALFDLKMWILSKQAARGDDAESHGQPAG